MKLSSEAVWKGLVSHVSNGEEALELLEKLSLARWKNDKDETEKLWYKASQLLVRVREENER